MQILWVKEICICLYVYVYMWGFVFLYLLLYGIGVFSAEDSVFIFVLLVFSVFVFVSQCICARPTRVAFVLPRWVTEDAREPFNDAAPGKNPTPLAKGGKVGPCLRCNYVFVLVLYLRQISLNTLNCNYVFALYLSCILCKYYQIIFIVIRYLYFTCPET